MSRVRKETQRRFSLRELLAFMSVVGGSLGMLRTCILFGDRAPHGLDALVALLGLGVMMLLTALIGLGVAMLAFGRRHAIAGAIIGSLLPLILFITMVIVVYRAHHRTRPVIVAPPPTAIHQPPS